MNERRCHRSTDPAEAAHLLLATTARRSGYAALALADSDGLLITDDRSGLDTEAVAAVAPLARQSTPHTEGLLALVTRGEAVRIWDFQMEGRTYYLVGVGGPASCPKGIFESLQRILLRPSLELAA
jgi:hypothetical protein